MTQEPYSRWLHRYAILVAGATFLLIIAGALVTSNDAGLSVPDWPTSFGSFRMPRMVGGVKFEHGHRMVAGVVTLLTIVLALWIWRSDSRRWVQRLAGLSVLTIFIQALLGGMTVLLMLPVSVSVAHACMAQLFFCLSICLALFTSEKWRWDEPPLEDHRSPSLRRLAGATTALIFLQLMVGAAFRHNGFGIVPHMIGAVLVTAGLIWVAIRVFSGFSDESRLARPVLLLVALLIAQIGLGIASYILKLSAFTAPQPLLPVVTVTTIHVAVGALVLASSLVVTLQAFRLTPASGLARLSPASRRESSGERMLADHRAV